MKNQNSSLRQGSNFILVSICVLPSVSAYQSQERCRLSHVPHLKPEWDSPAAVNGSSPSSLGGGTSVTWQGSHGASQLPLRKGQHSSGRSHFWLHASCRQLQLPGPPLTNRAPTFDRLSSRRMPGRSQRKGTRAAAPWGAGEPAGRGTGRRRLRVDGYVSSTTERDPASRTLSPDTEPGFSSRGGAPDSTRHVIRNRPDSSYLESHGSYFHSSPPAPPQGDSPIRTREAKDGGTAGWEGGCRYTRRSAQADRLHVLCKRACKH